MDSNKIILGVVILMIIIVYVGAYYKETEGYYSLPFVGGSIVDDNQPPFPPKVQSRLWTDMDSIDDGDGSHYVL